MVRSGGLPRGCQTEAKSSKIHGAVWPWKTHQEGGQKGWSHDVWMFLQATTPKMTIQSRAEDMVRSGGPPWGCQTEAKSLKIHGAVWPWKTHQEGGQKGWGDDIWIYLLAMTPKMTILAKAEDMVMLGVTHWGAKLRLNRWKSKVLSSYENNIKKGSKRMRS